MWCTAVELKNHRQRHDTAQGTANMARTNGMKKRSSTEAELPRRVTRASRRKDDAILAAAGATEWVSGEEIARRQEETSSLASTRVLANPGTKHETHKKVPD